MFKLRIIDENGVAHEIRSENAEVKLSGKWIPLSELGDKYVLLDREHSEKLHTLTYDFATGKTDGEELSRYVHEKLK